LKKNAEMKQTAAVDELLVHLDHPEDLNFPRMTLDSQKTEAVAELLKHLTSRTIKRNFPNKRFNFKSRKTQKSDSFCRTCKWTISHVHLI